MKICDRNGRKISEENGNIVIETEGKSVYKIEILLRAVTERQRKLQRVLKIVAVEGKGTKCLQK